MDGNRWRSRWFDRVSSADFWMIAGPILFFVAVFVLVLID